VAVTAVRRGSLQAPLVGGPSGPIHSRLKPLLHASQLSPGRVDGLFDRTVIIGIDFDADRIVADGDRAHTVQRHRRSLQHLGDLAVEVI